MYLCFLYLFVAFCHLEMHMASFRTCYVFLIINCYRESKEEISRIKEELRQKGKVWACSLY